jgi:hypothetical protein
MQQPGRMVVEVIIEYSKLPSQSSTGRNEEADDVPLLSIQRCGSPVFETFIHVAGEA